MATDVGSGGGEQGRATLSAAGTVSGVLPALYIDPPDVPLRRYGLFGATQSIKTADIHWLIGGVEWESLAQYAAEVYPTGFTQFDPRSHESKVLAQPQDLSHAWPFAVYAGIECGTIGYTPAEFEERARRVLDLAAQTQVEKALWSGGPGNSPSLNVTGTEDVTDGASTDITTAIGLLEDWLGDNYAGQGVIHARRSVAAVVAGAHILEREPIESGLVDALPGARRDQLITPVGTRFVFGGGYDGTGPADATPSAGTTWIYATGQLFIGRGEAIMPADFEHSINRLTNVETLLVEQPYIVGVDGTWAAALVQLPSYVAPH